MMGPLTNELTTSKVHGAPELLLWWLEASPVGERS